MPCKWFCCMLASIYAVLGQHRHLTFSAGRVVAMGECNYVQSVRRPPEWARICLFMVS